MRLMCSILVALAVMCTASARAETALVLEPQAEERLAQEARQSVSSALVDALRSEGFTVVTVEQARKAGATCGDDACIGDALARVRADVAVRATLMASPGSDALGSVGIAALQADGLIYRAKAARVLDHGVQRAIHDALGAVLERRRRGPGPWLVVSGSGAPVEVWLDGGIVYNGGLPAVLKVVADREHAVTVKRAGSRAEDFQLAVGPDAAATYELELPLPVAESPVRVGEKAGTSADASEPGASRGRRATWKDWALGGGVAVAGAALTINPLRTLAQKGDCYDDACRETTQFGARSGVLLGVGAALLISGLIVPTVWKPFGRVDVNVDQNTAVLRVSGHFDL